VPASIGLLQKPGIEADSGFQAQIKFGPAPKSSDAKSFGKEPEEFKNSISLTSREIASYVK
jgi:hypothetical protein